MQLGFGGAWGMEKSRGCEPEAGIAVGSGDQFSLLVQLGKDQGSSSSRELLWEIQDQGSSSIRDLP